MKNLILYSRKVWQGKFGKFGESSMIHQTKTIQISIYNKHLLADLLIRQTYFCQMLEKSQFVKLSRYMVISL